MRTGEPGRAGIRPRNAKTEEFYGEGGGGGWCSQFAAPQAGPGWGLRHRGRAVFRSGLRFRRVPRQPEHNSTAACASTERPVSQSQSATARFCPQDFCSRAKTALLVALLSRCGRAVVWRSAEADWGVRFCPAAATAARGKQRGGVRCRAELNQQPGHSSAGACASTLQRPQQPGGNSTAACATERSCVSSQGAAARGRALLQSAAPVRAQQQHGGVRFHRAPQQPGHSRRGLPAAAFFLIKFSPMADF